MRKEKRSFMRNGSRLRKCNLLLGAAWNGSVMNLPRHLRKPTMPANKTIAGADDTIKKDIL